MFSGSGSRKEICCCQLRPWLLFNLTRMQINTLYLPILFMSLLALSCALGDSVADLYFPRVSIPVKAPRSSDRNTTNK